jgi:hypothetical protein
VQGYVLYPRDSSAVVGATVQSDPPSAIAVTENDGWFLIGQNLRSGTRYRFSAKLGDTQGYEGSTYYTVHSTGRTQGAVDTIYIYLGLDGFDMDIDSELQEGADGQKCQGINCIQVNPIH